MNGRERAPLLAVAREAVRDALAVLLPVECSGCGAPDRAVCASCRAALAGAPRRIDRAGLVIWAGLEYSGTTASVLGAFKDGARTDAAAHLAPALRETVSAALADVAVGATVEVCTIPSTPTARRSRGYVPVEVLLRRCGIRVAPVLALARERADQAGLDAAARRRNAAGGLVAAAATRSFGSLTRPLDDRGAGLDGRRFLLVDDIVTTGSTLVEAVRAIDAAGGRTAAIAVLAETPRRFPRHAASSRETLRDIAAQGGYGGRTGVVDPPFRAG
ncbi:ComF family protein [Agromyces cerinus]|uniref:Predicted amidophosphoribosyltransferases n=1 Tax=Agromyces cerinus subsp. cerinus TaxID=232089 RepID=A0A1N6DIZ0_9MICO|nr:phosphoribosyltransferase family protein [Agromyces cerinus]SIN70785.1 Predicted amidophosphoribosyltransferases [Agromyces cerinus subsp. cerinus]